MSPRTTDKGVSTHLPHGDKAQQAWWFGTLLPKCNWELVTNGDSEAPPQATGSEPAFEHGQVGDSFTQCSANHLSLCPPGRGSPRSIGLIQWHWLRVGGLVIVTQHCVSKSTCDWLSQNGAKNTRLPLSSCSSQAWSLGWFILHSLQTALPVERNSLFSFIFLFY